MPDDIDTCAVSAITRAARGWLGTRFHHQGRLKKSQACAGGVDCLGLLVGVAAELGLRGRNGERLAALDSATYAHVPDGSALVAALRGALEEIAAGSAREGDVLVFTLEGSPRHLALRTDAGMIHAYAQARRVVEHALDESWCARLAYAFRIPPQGISTALR